MQFISRNRTIELCSVWIRSDGWEGGTLCCWCAVISSIGYKDAAAVHTLAVAQARLRSRPRGGRGSGARVEALLERGAVAVQEGSALQARGGARRISLELLQNDRPR